MEGDLSLLMRMLAWHGMASVAHACAVAHLGRMRHRAAVLWHRHAGPLARPHVRQVAEQQARAPRKERLQQLRRLDVWVDGHLQANRPQQWCSRPHPHSLEGLY